MLRQFFACTAVFGFAISAGSTAVADDEHWTENTPYYEEDEWYDVTDWFDGNNYSRVDPSEVRENREDDYGYDANDDSDNWYYDYQDTGYADTEDSDRDGTFDSFTRFYDFDGDGFYDAYYASYDTDNNGTYDQFTYYTFNAKADDGGEQAKQNASTTSKARSITGNVVQTKKVAVQDTRHLIVELKRDGGQSYLIDLGPTDRLSAQEPRQGDQISAKGIMTQVGDRRVLLAKSITRDGQTHNIDRAAKEFDGTIQKVKTAKVRGREHQLVVLESDDQQRLVDLGPSDRLTDLELKQGQSLTVQGPRVQANDRTLVIAQRVSQGDESLQVDRGPQKNQKNQQVSQR